MAAKVYAALFSQIPRDDDWQNAGYARIDVRKAKIEDAGGPIIEGTAERIDAVPLLPAPRPFKPRWAFIGNRVFDFEANDWGLSR